MWFLILSRSILSYNLVSHCLLFRNRRLNSKYQTKGSSSCLLLFDCNNLWKWAVITIYVSIYLQMETSLEPVSTPSRERKHYSEFYIHTTLRSDTGENKIHKVEAVARKVCTIIYGSIAAWDQEASSFSSWITARCCRWDCLWKPPGSFCWRNIQWAGYL